MDTNLILIKAEKNENFTVADLTCVQDNNLSWKAKGLHLYLISRPPDWKIMYQDLVNRSTDGEVSLRSALEELEKNFYISKKRGKTKKGLFYTQYIVYEKPYTPQYHPHEVFHSGSSTVGNQDYNNNKEISINNNLLSSNKLEDNKYSAVLEKWNSEGIINHKKLNDGSIKLIDETLKFIPLKKLLKSIQNYAEVLRNPNYYWTYRWTLQQFLSRGSSKQGNKNSKGWKQFIDEAEPFKVFLDNNYDPFKSLVNQFQPITSQYKQILDKEANLYYGFPMEKVDNYVYNCRWVDDCWNNIPNKYGYFRELEIAIAGLIKVRRYDPQLEKLEKYITYWNKLKERFKK